MGVFGRMLNSLVEDLQREGVQVQRALDPVGSRPCRGGVLALLLELRLWNSRVAELSRGRPWLIHAQQ